MKYVISTKEEIDIDVGDKVSFVEEFQAKYPGFYAVSETLDTYLIVDLKKDGKFAFGPSLIASIKRSASDKIEPLAPSIIAVVESALPALVETAVQDAIRTQLTSEFVETLLPKAVDKEVKKALIKAFVDIKDFLRGQ